MLADVLQDLAAEIQQVGGIDGSEAFIDASFVRAKGGGAHVRITNAGNGVKIMAIVDRRGLPLSIGPD